MRHSTPMHGRLTVGCLLALAVVAYAGTSVGSSAEQSVDASDFLPNWMGHLAPVVGNLPLADLAILRTHDALSHDLSMRVSEGAWDNHPEVSEFLHLIKPLTPGNFIRDVARTQGLGPAEQLDSGVRFLDVRWMMDRIPLTSEHDWYSLHFVQSNEPVLVYMKEVRAWLDAHPREVIVLQATRHGGTGEVGHVAYPFVSVSAKRAFYARFKVVFEGLFFDPRVSTLNDTSLNTLVDRNHRVVFYMNDWAEFTNSDPIAINSGPAPPSAQKSWSSVSVEAEGWYMSTFNSLVDSVSHSSSSIVSEKKKNHLFFSGGVFPQTQWGHQIVLQAKIRFLPFTKGYARECAALYGVEGMTDYCPSTLMESSTLENYLVQVAIERAYLAGARLPSISANGVDYGGTLRVGTSIDFSPQTALLRGSDAHGKSAYALVPTLLASSVRWACGVSHKPECESTLTMLEGLRAKHPMTLWDDVAHGRVPSFDQLPPP